MLKQAEEYIARIDELGGAPKAIERGYMQQEIMDSAYRYQKDIEKGERVVVGVNQFRIDEEPPKGLLRVDPEVEVMQKQKLLELKEKRNSPAVATSLEALRIACSSEENLMPYILSAVRAYATLGEICGVMRDEFGEYIGTAIL